MLHIKALRIRENSSTLVFNRSQMLFKKFYIWDT